MGDLIHLGAHENMTPEEALAVAAREEWEGIIILGYQEGHFVLRSSAVSREHALWLLEMAKRHSLDLN